LQKIRLKSITRFDWVKIIDQVHYGLCNPQECPLWRKYNNMTAAPS